MSIVAASGANIFPSIPCSVKSGTRMMAMMSTEKATGRATSTSASATMRRLCSFSVRCARWRRMFSTTTMEASTTMPTEKARPPRLMRFEVSPVEPMTMKLTRKVSGSEKTTMSAVRSSATKRKRTRMTKMPPSRSASTTVLMHASMSEVRS